VTADALRLPQLPGALRRAVQAIGLPHLVIGFWALAGIVAALQGSIEHLVHGGPLGRELFRADRWLLLLWALAVPAILWSARRRPLAAPFSAKNLALHVAVATLFIVATNVVIRLPGDPSLVARGTALGLARFYPAALIVYLVIVAVGSQLLAERGVAGDGPALDSGSTPADRVVIREWNRVRLVRPESIEWIEADDNNVVVHVDGRVYKGRGRISDLESQLDSSAFARVHRSAIVRIACIREVQPLSKGDFALVLASGKVLRAARSRRAALESALRLRL